MVQVSFSTSTTFEGDPNALVENQRTALTVRFDLDEPAPAGGLKVYVDSEVEQIVNRLDLTGFEFRPIAENIDPSSIDTNSDSSGFFLTVDVGATAGSFTINVLDNLEPDRALPEILDGLVESEFSLVTTDGVTSEDAEFTGDLGDYTVDPDAASSTVLFADNESQLPVSPPPLNPGYDEAVSGDVSDDPTNPLELPLSEGITPLSVTTGDRDQEYVTVTIPEGFQLDTLVLESFSESNVAFIGVQEGDTFTEPLNDSAVRGNLLGYALFGEPRQVGTDILDNIARGWAAMGFEGALPGGVYTFALQQIGISSDYTLAFNVSESTDESAPEPAGDFLTGDNFLGGRDTDTVTDFDPTEEVIGLLEGELGFDDIEAIEIEGEAAINAMVAEETLGVFEGIETPEIAEELFIAAPDIALG
ncbi:hypothetical protein M595_3291 [Lyngbya aestuarii BL J]|uniref:Uncharacterized protein n=1 Tax=Lyngbya aestuarii BL J TaxID=1348334 RepID=U7QI37_9CYAN|nr:hypothetical protein [Lyngbya aestuarii]ERT06750.1 hypothetical protein M595_3291 [Lyngbya aestuarii BL J]